MVVEGLAKSIMILSAFTGGTPCMQSGRRVFRLNLGLQGVEVESD